MWRLLDQRLFRDTIRTNHEQSKINVIFKTETKKYNSHNEIKGRERVLKIEFLKQISKGIPNLKYASEEMVQIPINVEKH